MKKKVILSLAAIMLVMALLAAPAFAHGHRGSISGSQSASYALCTIEESDTAGTHQHGRIYYSGHSLDDGQDYHQVCTVQGCTKTVSHEHDGVTCFPHSDADGHSYHNSGHGGKGHHH